MEKNKPVNHFAFQKDTNVKKNEIKTRKLIRIRKQQKCIKEIYAMTYSRHISFSSDHKSSTKRKTRLFSESTWQIGYKFGISVK